MLCCGFSGTFVIHEDDGIDGCRVVRAPVRCMSFAPTIGAAGRGGLFALLKLYRDRLDDTVSHAGCTEKVVQLVSILRLVVKRDGGGCVAALADVDVRRAMRCCL
jgi:hypothetical protein